MNRQVKQLEINRKNALTVDEAGFLQYRFFELIVVENNLYGNLLSNAKLCPLCIYVIVSSQNKATPTHTISCKEFSAFWSAGGRQERRRDTGILTEEILRLPVLSLVTVNRPIKKIAVFFHYASLFW